MLESKRDTSKNLKHKNIKEIEGLVLLQDLDSNIIIDLKYATEDNFVKKAVYPVPVCAIHKATGLKLVQANKIFKEKGYTLKVWDAYRPLHVQQIFYDNFLDTNFVAVPKYNQKSNFKPSHNNGMSVDVTLVDESLNEIEMPTEFDDFSIKASANYQGMSEIARKNVDYLIEVMESVGFKNYEGEWWHFDDIIETPTPYLDISLEKFI